MSLRKVASFWRLDFLAILAGAPNDLFYKTLFGEANIALDFLVLEHDQNFLDDRSIHVMIF